MSDAPERIALRWELGAAVTSGPLMTHPDYTQYTRTDLAAAAEARARMEGWNAAIEAAAQEAASEGWPDGRLLGTSEREEGAMDCASRIEIAILALRKDTP